MTPRRASTWILLTVKPTARPGPAALWTVLCLVLGLTVAGAGIGEAQPGAVRYTIVGFSTSSDRDMDVYESTDGSAFGSVRDAAFRPPSGLIRDPSIFRHSDGQYYVAYTTGGGANIGFARSSNRVDWTPMGNYPVPLCCAFLPGTGDGTGSAGPPGLTGSAGSSDGPSLSPFTTKAWAPEWFVDGDRVNLILSMSTGGGFVPYLMTALDPSLTQWSFPLPIAGLGADRIDTTVVKAGAVYHAFTKNETNKVLEHAIAPTLAGPYTFVPPGDWGALVEGPAVVQLPNGHWRIYFDAYTEGKYFYSDSADGLLTWSPRQEVPGLSGTVRHFGVLTEPV